MFKAAIGPKMHQMVSKIISFTKIPKLKNPNKYLLEMLNTQLTFAIPE